MVIAVPRFHGQRFASGEFLPTAPRSILVAGQHWCGHSEVGRFLAEALDYDYSCVGLIAALTHSTAPHADRVDDWRHVRQDICRTYSWDAGLGRPRVWTADLWTDVEALEIASRHSDGPFIVYLKPDDALVRYCAFAHTARIAAAEPGEAAMSGGDYEEQIRELRDRATRLLRTRLGGAPGRFLEVTVTVPDGLLDYAEATDPFGVDSWFDAHAARAGEILPHVLRRRPSELAEARARAGLA